MTSRLVLILGDQLTRSISSLRQADKAKDQILMAEVMAEATYVRHHKKKIAFIFSAMRHFAHQLRSEGWQVDYVALDDPDNSGALGSEVLRAVQKYQLHELIITEPGEWRLLQEMKGWDKKFDLKVRILPDDRFVATHQSFCDWAKGRKQLRMEYFYRDMRRKTSVLMDGDKPEGGKWNYDADNRKPAGKDLFMPRPKRFVPDSITRDVLALVEAKFADHFGDLEPFWFAVTAKQAQAALDEFVASALANFGDYQDAMLVDEPFLYHSMISLYINTGLLDPLVVCRQVENAYYEGKAPLNAVEGFIRQIIGWREYVRGIYWLKMPDYATLNYLENSRDLPSFYWTGDTEMLCLHSAITQTRQHAYAHHIQRLMITGNFALLAGIDPHQVHEWYLAVYADAYEWVELPNTLGMSQFADGGLLGSKPYVSSGNYIHKMSDYCGSCVYDVTQKTGEKACPFNALYWGFLARHEDRLKSNPRLAQPYRTWYRMAEERRADYLASAAAFLDGLG